MVCACIPCVASTSKQGTFAGSQCTAYFITKIHVAGGINQVQDILLVVFVFVIDLYGVALDGDTLFTFQVHVIQHLVHHISVADGAGGL